MAQHPFEYGRSQHGFEEGPAHEPSGHRAAGREEPPVVVSVFADRARIRDIVAQDAAAAGLLVRSPASLDELHDGAARALGDVVLVDCPVADARTIATLARLDERAARSGARLIVSTSVDGLDAVFGCMDRSDTQILVDPDRAQRVIALGHALAGFAGTRVRELSEDDRLMLLRLSEQVGQIAGRIDRLAPGLASTPAEPREAGLVLATTGGQPAGGSARGASAGQRSSRPPLPDPRLVRRMLRQRQQRARFFGEDLFADPAWDMLLDLTAARAEHVRVSVTSLCIAACVPATTALRWIGQMVEAGLFERQIDDTDRRRAFIALSDRAADAMARYFAECGQSLAVAA